VNGAGAACQFPQWMLQKVPFRFLVAFRFHHAEKTIPHRYPEAARDKWGVRSEINGTEKKLQQVQRNCAG
jgi:hypothetical protein